jgi:hypothetical protein
MASQLNRPGYQCSIDDTKMNSEDSLGVGTKSCRSEYLQRNLPRLVMGCDGFVGFCAVEPRPAEMLTEEYAYRVMSEAYALGVRGFDFSFELHMIRAISRLRVEAPDTICFANPNWRCGVVLGGTDLIDLRSRILATICAHSITKQELREAQRLMPHLRRHIFPIEPGAQPLSLNEIDSICLDAERLDKRLLHLRGLADYCLVGTDICDWLLALGRDDIVLDMYRAVLDNGMLPMALTHWPSLTVPRLLHCGLAGYWCLLNPGGILFTNRGIGPLFARVAKPIYAFGILRSNARSPSGIEQAIASALGLSRIYGVVVGLKTVAEARETVPIALRLLERRGGVK